MSIIANPISSDDVVPVSDLKVNPGRVISQLDKTRRQDLVTSHGRGVAVVQSVKDYEAEAAERVFLKATLQGVMDVEGGRTVNLAGYRRDRMRRRTSCEARVWSDPKLILQAVCWVCIYPDGQ